MSLEKIDMTRKKVGLILFWVGAVYAFILAVPTSVSVDTAFRSMTMAELNETVWSVSGFWFPFWGFSPPVAVLIAGIGALLYSGAKGSTVWKFGIGIALVVFLAMALISIGHIPPLLGTGGAFILLSFLGLLWLWAKERMALKGSSATAADLQLVGYVLFVIAAWFTCGALAQPFQRAFEGSAPTTPVHIMVFLVLGWLFLFLSHYQTHRKRRSQG
jgi:hypothetical protein